MNSTSITKFSARSIEKGNAICQSSCLCLFGAPIKQSKLPDCSDSLVKSINSRSFAQGKSKRPFGRAKRSVLVLYLISANFHGLRLSRKSRYVNIQGP